MPGRTPAGGATMSDAPVPTTMCRAACLPRQERQRRRISNLVDAPRTRHAFTLIELLVVIAILGALIGLMLPAMHRAREQAYDTKCLSNLRTLYLAHSSYLHDQKRFPNLNNEDDDGAWQYNYLIFDGRDFNSNFGPLLNDGVTLDTNETLYCPRQTDPYHARATPENPWPTVLLLDTRSGYARRYHLTGKTLSDFAGNPALFTDIFHLPKVVLSGHKSGVNVAYLDGHVSWVKDRGFLIESELTRPFRREDNDVIEDIWDEFDESKR